jgi:hypothetical protein
MRPNLDNIYQIYNVKVEEIEKEWENIKKATETIGI